MPFRSEKQRRFLWAEHPDIARRWADEYPLNGKKLPMYAKDKAENSGEKTPENEADVIKAAKDILKRIKMPTNTGPTYAGQTDISSEQASTSILDENTPKTEETAGLNKCGMIPATSNAQRWENEKARNEGRPAQRISAVPGVKRQAVPSIYNPLPMALTQQSANSATKPAAVQSATPSNDAANRLMKDTIGSFGPIAANGNLNGNAAFGVKNSPNSSKTSSHHAAEKSARISAPMCPCGCNEKSYNCTCPKWCVCRNPGMPCAPKKRKTTPPKNQEKSAAPFAWNQTLINDLLQSNKLHRNLNTAVSTVSPMLLNSIGKRLGFGVGPALSMGANLGHAGVAHGLNTQQKMLQAFQIPDANTGTVKQNSALKFAQIGATKKAVDDPRQHGVYNPELHALLQKWEAAGGTAADDKPLSRHIAQSLQQYMENPHMKPGAPSAERQPLPLWRRVFARKEEPWVDNLDAFETLTLLDDLQPLQKRAKLSPAARRGAQFVGTGARLGGVAGLVGGGIYGAVNPGEYIDANNNKKKRSRLMGAVRGGMGTAAVGLVSGGLAGYGTHKATASKENAQPVARAGQIIRAERDPETGKILSMSVHDKDPEKNGMVKTQSINDPQFNLVYPDYKPNYVMPQHLRKNVLKPEEALRVLHAMREMAPHGALDNTRLDWHGLQIKGYGTRVQNNDKITNLGRWLHHTTGDEFEATHPSKTQGFGDAFLPAANLVSVPSGMGGTLMHELGHAVDFNAFPSQSTPRHLTAALYRNYAPTLWKEHAAWKKGKKTLLQAFADNKIDPQLTHRVLTNAAGAKRLGLGSYWGGAVGGTVGAGLSAAGLIGLMALLRNSGAGHVQIPGRLAALPVVLATMAGVAGGTGIGHLMARKPVASEKITKVMARALARKQGIPFAEAQRQIEEALNAKKTDNAKPLEKELKKAANASPAWQRSAGKNPEGGLNEKGRKSYERETGGNLKAPVTESNPKGERKARRSSFCARMGGMKKKLTSKATAGDPDSRINKALRKWNCKSGAWNQDLVSEIMLASKTAGVHGHFIHAVGLTPEERKYLNRQAARVAKWRQGLYQAFLDRQTAEMAKLPPGSSNEGWEYRAGGSPNFRDDVLAAFQEKYPNANVWPGNAIEFQKRGPRRWLGLRAGKQLPVGEGYAVLMSHYPKEMMQNPEMDEYQPDYDVVTDFYGDVDSNVHDALNSITGGRYGLPTPKKTAAYKGITEFSGMPGPDQISHAVAQLGMLKALVRPDDSVLKQRGITRSGFQSGLRDIYNHSRDKDRFELSEMAPQPNTHAALGAAGGIGAAGLLGYAGVRNPAVLAGTAVIPAIAAYFRARHKRHNLLNTAKLVKDYGLLRPKLLRQAYPLLASDD